MTPPPDPTGPTDPPVTTPVPPPDRPQYEFTPPQNAVIDDLARSLAWVGIPLLVLAVINAVNAVVHFARVGQSTAELVPAGGALIGAVFFFLLSSWLSQAAAAFDRVAHTTGYDISHLMAALANLGRTFGVLAFLIQVYVVVAVVLLVAALVMALTGGSTAA